MRKLVSSMTTLVLLSTIAAAQTKVFIAPMDEGFDSFLAAALLDNKVPVAITYDECSAAYVITGHAVKGQNKWYDTVFGAERDRNQGSIKLLRVSDKSVVWAGAAGDRSLWWGALKSGGQKKVANRLARELKKEYFDGRPVEETPGTCIPLPPKTSATGDQLPTVRAESNLKINSTPVGAEILLNGKPVGSTPLSVAVKSGEWTVTIRKHGFRPWEKFVRVPPGETVTLDAVL
jgi:hypothetical protein